MQINRRTALRCIACSAVAWNSAQLSLSRNCATDCSPRTQNGFEAEFPSMGSKINLRWFAEESEQNRIAESARQMADKWVAILSDYEPNSQAMLACASADCGDWIPISDELWTVVQMCDQWHHWSNGAFDAALGSITRLRRQRKSASKTQWEEARIKSGWHLLALDAEEKAIRFTVPGVRFDFGAIGKGFVVDRIAEKLVELGIERYVVNASGNMRIGKAPSDSQGWPIAIDIPPQNSSKLSVELFRMRMSQCGIATSGDRWQRFPNSAGSAKEDDSSHIIDPSTSAGVTGQQSVTIVAENATDADAAATATCVRANRDLPGWLEVLAEKKPKLEAYALLRDASTSPVRFISTT